MALGSLAIIYIILALVIVISQFFLYQQNTLEINFIFIVNIILSVLVSWINFSALPVNYTNQKFLSLIWGTLGIVSLFLVLSRNKKELSKIILTIALFGGFLQLILI